MKPDIDDLQDLMYLWMSYAAVFIQQCLIQRLKPRDWLKLVHTIALKDCLGIP